MSHFLLIDTQNLLMRAARATQGDAFDKSGLALSIVINSINHVYKKFGGGHCVFFLDGKSWRKDYYAPYKANRAITKMKKTQRELDEDQIFYDMVTDFTNFIDRQTKCTVVKHSRCEADDLIARWIQIFGADDNNTFTILSADSDFVQLLSKQTQIYDGLNKRTYTMEGVYDERGKPVMKKKTNKKDTTPDEPIVIDPEYFLFEKCIRGDTSDNIASAYPGIREKGSKNRIGIREAYDDRKDQSYSWVNFMKTVWTDAMGIDHVVEVDYLRNKELIDLTQQPQEIIDAMDTTILEILKEDKDVNHVGASLLKFCTRHELKKIADSVDQYLPIFNTGFEI